MNGSKRGTAYLPLHYGRPPENLYRKIVTLTGKISDLICEIYGTQEFITRISDPFWFHSLSIVTGFDWNSSGTTTTTIHALKEYASRNDTSFFVVGGKGKHMREKGNEIESLSQHFQSNSTGIKLKRETDLIAKIDSNLLQDSYNLYIHSAVSDYKGNYSVIQQGMNVEERMARRYHWLSKDLELKNIEARTGIEAGRLEDKCMDLSSRQSRMAREGMLAVIKEAPGISVGKQTTLDSFDNKRVLNLSIKVPWKTLEKLYEFQPGSMEDVLLTPGVGQSAIRALCYISEVITGATPSFTDPVRYAYALGGKDGIPKPINHDDYDFAINYFSELLRNTGMQSGERNKVLSRLSVESERSSLFFMRDLPY